MGELKILIVDDEPLARNILEEYVDRMPDLVLIGSCKNALEAFSILSRQSVDVLLLDVNMPEINGIELLQTLKDPPAVIFTTAYPEFALVSYELNAIDYLLKPFPFERFLKAIDKLRITKPHLIQKTNEFTAQGIIFVKSDGKLLKIELDQLLFVEGVKDYMKLWTEFENLVIYGTMKNMEEQLTKRSNFLRVNKSYIINLNHVHEVDGNTIRIKHHAIPIGNTYRTEVKETLNKFKLL